MQTFLTPRVRDADSKPIQMSWWVMQRYTCGRCCVTQNQQPLPINTLDALWRVGNAIPATHMPTLTCMLSHLLDNVQCSYLHTGQCEVLIPAHWTMCSAHTCKLEAAAHLNAWSMLLGGEAGEHLGGWGCVKVAERQRHAG